MNQDPVPLPHPHTPHYLLRRFLPVFSLVFRTTKGEYQCSVWLYQILYKGIFQNRVLTPLLSTIPVDSGFKLKKNVFFLMQDSHTLADEIHAVIEVPEARLEEFLGNVNVSIRPVGSGDIYSEVNHSVLIGKRT